MGEQPRRRPPGRRWVALGCALLVGAIVLTVRATTTHLHGTGSEAGARIAAGPAHEVAMRVYVTDAGLGWEIVPRMPDDATLSDARLHVAGLASPAEMWPQRNVDDVAPDDLVVQAGDRVSLSGGLMPDCGSDDPDLTASFTVTETRADGEQQLLRFVSSTPLEVADELEEWCATEPWATAGGTRLEPDGDAVISIGVVNPGPEAIRVEVAAYADDHVRWEELAGWAPPATWSHFELVGHEVGCEPGERASWEDGGLLLDGEPFVVEADDAWC